VEQFGVAIGGRRTWVECNGPEDRQVIIDNKTATQDGSRNGGAERSAPSQCRTQGRRDWNPI